LYMCSRRFLFNQPNTEVPLQSRSAVLYEVVLPWLQI
jgi:hypothetical protein